MGTTDSFRLIPLPIIPAVYGGSAITAKITLPSQCVAVSRSDLQFETIGFKEKMRKDGDRASLIHCAAHEVQFL